MRLCLPLLALLVLGVVAVGCGDPGIVDKQFECQDDQDCQKSHACENGKCVFADNDKDGFAKNKDCNDNNKEVYPGAPEICDNGADDNCDGRTDEQPCSCKDGETRDCGSDKGICKLGKQTCNAGVWSLCEGAVDPQEELCDGKDNDCDGDIDEGVPGCCQPKETRPCGSQIGTCKQGVQNCQLGAWTECIGAVGPEEETCDGKDNDCDGKIDNIKNTTKPIEQACFSGPPENRKKGACKDGVQYCKAGKWSLCENDVLPEDEVCDGKDNDCDGQVDNVKGEDKILERDCYSADPTTKDKGVCKGGTQRCVNGTWSGCLGEITPIQESCNGVDDDCDGKLDNTPNTTKPLSRSCYSGPPDTRQKGLCADGTQECVNGRWQGCKGDTLPDKEVCDGKDNDCDGRTDNNPGKNDPLVESCYSGPVNQIGVGECKAGTRSCQNGQYSACVGSITPQTEVCDGKDNDCDGQNDNNIASPGTCTSSGKGECRSGTQQCINAKIQCVQDNQPSPEVCDNKDNDCDGTVDEGVPGTGVSCSVPGAKGICLPGTRRCVSGQIKCVSNTNATNEACNGKDDDCDGTIDDNATCPRGYACGAGRCNLCPQPEPKCENYDLFCTADAPPANCNCGLTPYCPEPSSSLNFACPGCCAKRGCR